MALLTNINGKFSVSDAGAVTFNNAFTFPTADGTANYVLKTNGSGQLAWAADNDGGDITGSGTANTVTKFTGTKVIGDGPITFATNDSTFAGTVLIDGVSNYTGLEVKGAGASRPQIKFSNVNQGTLAQIYGTESNSLVTTVPAGLEYQVRNANGAGGDHVFKSYNTAILTLDGGTNNATFAGNITISKATPFITLSNTAEDECGIVMLDSADAGQSAKITYDAGSSNSLKFYNNAANERMRIDSSGNVFINGQTDNILGVNTSDGSDNKSITITSSAVASSNRGGYASFYGNEHATFAGNTFVVAGNTSGAELRLHAVNSSGIITAYTAGSERMRITSAGNVGIGVTPSATQAITTQITNGLSLFGNNSTPYGFISNNHAWTSPGGDQYLVSNYGASYYKQYQGVHSWATAPSGTAGGSLTFTERMRIDSSGNVGIGATSPGANLEIKTLTGGAGANTLRLNTDFGGGNAVDINPFITGINNGGMEIKLAGSQKLVILPNGNVGIGTASPGAKLSIYKTAFGGDTAGSGGTLDFGVGSTKYWQFRLDSSSSGDLAIDKTYASVWTTPVTIQRSSGNVGIGTDSPDRILHIESDSVAAIQLENTSEADSFIDFKNPSRTFRVGYDDSADLFKVAVTNFNSNAFVVNSSGNVGIGTDSPSGPFHVKVGTSTPLIVASSSYCNNVGIRTTTPTASLQVKGNVSYSYNNYTNVANTWINVINFSGYPAGLYQISIIKKTDASTYITAIVKWSATAGTVISTIASNQLGITFSGTQLQAISGVATGTLMSANLQCLVTNEDFCS